MRCRTRDSFVNRRLALALACALALAACSGGSDGATAPDAGPPMVDPGPGPDPAPDPTPEPTAGIQGDYTLEGINGSQPGQLVTIANPDGKVVGLYRFDARSTLHMDALQTFQLQLRYSDDKAEYGLPDEGEFKQAGPVSQGVLPLTFSSKVYGDSFIGVALGDVVAIEYDFDGDGRPDVKFGFRRTG